MTTNVKPNLLNNGTELFQTAAIVLNNNIINEGLNAPPPSLTNPPNDSSPSLFSSVLDKVLLGAMFVGSTLSFAQLALSVRALAKAENRNFEKVAEFGINLFRTTVVGLFWASLFTGIGFALPYLIPISCGLGAAWGLYHAGKHAYYAYQERKTDKFSGHVMTAASHVLSATVNGLGMFAAIATNGINSMLSSAKNMFLDGWKHMNFKEMGEAAALAEAGQQKFNALKPVVTALTYIQIATITPVRWIGTKIKNLFSKKTEVKSNARPKMVSGSSDPIIGMLLKQNHSINSVSSVPVETRISIEPKLRRQHQQLMELIAKQKKHLSKQGSDKKHNAKRLVIDELEQNLGTRYEDCVMKKSVKEIEAAAKDVSSLVKQSFFRVKGTTEKILELAHEFEATMNGPASAA